jgi:hypothetical protein
MGFTTVLSTVFKTVAETKKLPLWKYRELDQQPMLYSSNYLKELVVNARDQASLARVAKYIKRHEAEGIESYQVVLKIITKVAKELTL